MTYILEYDIFGRQQQYDAALLYLRNHVMQLPDNLRELCMIVLEDEKFLEIPASCQWHHVYDGGTVIHTAEVLEIALNILKAKPIDADRNVLIVSIIWHDYGKIKDYKKWWSPHDPMIKSKGNTSYEYAPHHDLISHLPRSYHEFLKHAERFDVPEEFSQKVEHCIIAHHGRKEWRSPAEPQTPEAYIIHFADMLSLNACKDKYVRTDIAE